jgi:hypothetical protein
MAFQILWSFQNSLRFGTTPLSFAAVAGHYSAIKVHNHCLLQRLKQLGCVWGKEQH